MLWFQVARLQITILSEPVLWTICWEIPVQFGVCLQPVMHSSAFNCILSLQMRHNYHYLKPLISSSYMLLHCSNCKFKHHVLFPYNYVIIQTIINFCFSFYLISVNFVWPHNVLPEKRLWGLQCVCLTYHHVSSAVRRDLMQQVWKAVLFSQPAVIICCKLGICEQNKRAIIHLNHQLFVNPGACSLNSI